MDPIKIIQKYYKIDSLAYNILLEHSEAVADKALKIAKRCSFDVDLEFLYEGAMLHDIGIFMTKMPNIDCNGDNDYICHGVLGREILDKEGFSKHGLVCERHVGIGLTEKDIEEQGLPLPRRDMRPVSVEEEIICYADKFFTKNVGSLRKEKDVETIRKGLLRFGQSHVDRFNEWVLKFGE